MSSSYTHTQHTIPRHRLFKSEPCFAILCFFLSLDKSRSQGTERLAVVDGMSPLDLDATVCGDAFFDGSGTEEELEDPYAPAESLRLRIGEDIDWCDVGGGAVVAAVLRRDDSTKGAGANPKSAARRSVRSQAAAAPRAKVAAVVIGGLPGKVRCSPCRLGGRARVFAAGEQQAGVGHDRLEEPGSPKVSCLGAVRPEQRSAGRGMSRRAHAWRSWLAARVTCCFSGHQRGSDADD